MASTTQGLGRWLDDRLGWASVKAALANRRVPNHNPAYYLGALALFSLTLQVTTGILLVLHYEPGAATAYNSTLKIVGQVPFGDVIHGIHVWSGDILVATVAVHLLSVLARRSFVAPREMVWVTGMFLLMIVIGMSYSGLILPWSQMSVYQARVGSEIAGQLPLIGDWAAQIVRGGQYVTSATLQHAYGFHVAVLPALMTVLFLLHAVTLRRGGKPPPEGRSTIPVYPDFLVRMAAAWVALFVVILSLALFVERPLGSPADLSSAAPAGARPPWYFLYVHALLRAAPPKLVGLDSAQFIVGVGALLFLVALFLPFLDRKGSRFTTVVAGLFLLFAVTMTLYGLT
jgi:quinol-cytochrome oxidoreductase complex cytochrome b subunit